MELSRIKATAGVVIITAYLAWIFWANNRPIVTHFGLEHDFVTVVTGSRCIVDRCDPYDSPTLEREFQKMGGYTPSRHFKPEWPVYPPSTLLLLFPLSVLPWSVFSVIWMWLCGGLVTAAFIVIFLKCKGYRDLLSVVPFVLMLADRSIGWAVQLGQPVLVASGSLALAVVTIESGSMPILSTILLAISLIIKPQGAYLCAAYFLLRRATRLPALAAGLVTAFTAAAGTLVYYLRLSSLAYLGHLAINLKLAVSPGGDADFTLLNADNSASYLNLQAWLARFVQDPKLCNDITYVLCAALGCLLIFVCWRSKTLATRPYTLLTALIMLELLLSYHRLYDHIIILAAIPGFFEVKERGRFSYVLLLLGLFAYHFSQLHKMTIYGKGPFSSGPPVELLIFAVCSYSLWQNRRILEPQITEPTPSFSVYQVEDLTTATR